MATTSSTAKEGTLFSVSSLETKAYDVILIGSGWASRPVAERAVRAGLTALIIDNELMGGDCPYWACVPSKALLRPSEALEACSAVGGARERLANPNSTVDTKAVFARRDAFTRGWDDTKLLVPAILATGTDLLRGTGKLVGVKKVAVISNEGVSIDLVARHAVVVGTGSTPVIPTIHGLEEAESWIWTPREATSSSEIPEHLVILGAGAVGCEMATAYCSFGSKVTVMSHSKEILPKIDPEAGEIIRRGLEARGVRFLLQESITRVEQAEDGSIVVRSALGLSVSASKILVAAGRKPRTDGCGLELFDIPVDGTPIDVDESLRVKGLQWLYAVGDVNGRSPLTHMCKYQGRIAGTAIVRQVQGSPITSRAHWDAISATADQQAIPQVVFTQPALASVGLTRIVAEKQNRRVRVIRSPAVSVGALLHGDNFGQGWAQWIVDVESEKLVGMTVVGQDVAELIHGATIAIAGGLRLNQLAHAVPCFPTMSEVYLNLAEAAGI